MEGRGDFDAIVSVIEDYYRGTTETDEALEPYCRVLAVDATGDTAVARLENDYIGQRFTDYLTLLRGPEVWRIVNKAFVHDGPA